MTQPLNIPIFEYRIKDTNSSYFIDHKINLIMMGFIKIRNELVFREPIFKQSNNYDFNLYIIKTIKKCYENIKLECVVKINVKFYLDNGLYYFYFNNIKHYFNKLNFFEIDSENPDQFKY